MIHQNPVWYVESAKLLLEHKNINVNIIPDNDRDRWTPLHWACYRGSLEVVDLLLERADIDPNATLLADVYGLVFRN